MTHKQKRAVAEAKKQAANRLHRLVRPFECENTKHWRDRDRIRNALKAIRNNADEAYLCLQVGHRLRDQLPQASVALCELEAAIKEMNA